MMRNARILELRASVSNRRQLKPNLPDGRELPVSRGADDHRHVSYESAAGRPLFRRTSSEADWRLSARLRHAGSSAHAGPDIRHCAQTDLGRNADISKADLRLERTCGLTTALQAAAEGIGGIPSVSTRVGIQGVDAALADPGRHLGERRISLTRSAGGGSRIRAHLTAPAPRA